MFRHSLFKIILVGIDFTYLDNNPVIEVKRLIMKKEML